MLAIKHLSASIDSKEILRDISFSFEREKTYALLGPNGSGKSTLAGAIMGHPALSLDPTSDIVFEGASLLALSPDKRACLGVFASLQSPPALPGVSTVSLLRFALPDAEPLETRRRAEAFAAELAIAPSLLSRGLYDGFSGGEKKKFETLLWAMLRPKISFFDELDTGVDVDAQKIIAGFLKTHRTPEQTLVFITHSTAFLEALPPDETLVLKNGAIERVGDGALARRIIEEEGFGKQE